jgi:glutamine phosphoribosylpyrophosphate amidotransferase
MCEHFVARAAEPFRLDELWEFTAALERWGIAGLGWGASWVGSDGLEAHRDIRGFREDPARDDVGRAETTAVLIHLRRPSKLSTIGLADTQPFDDPAGRYAFSHNGDLANHLDWRNRYRAEGRIHGRADTETGARWLEDEWLSGATPPRLLASLHDTFGGLANLAVITADGAVHHYAGNRDNPVFSFRLGRIGLASTGIYSIDRSLFKFVAPGATSRRLVPLGRTASLDSDGTATAA